MNPSNEEVFWEEETLILFYYGELEPEIASALKHELSNSKSLAKRYQQLTQFLDDGVKQDIPEPSKNFEQNIMAAVAREAEKRTAQKSTYEASQSHWFSRLFLIFDGATLRKSQFSSVVVTGMLVVGVFFVGRWSSQLNEQPRVAETSSESAKDNQTNRSNDSLAKAGFSQRVLMTRVQEHLESSERLFTLVANGNGDLPMLMQKKQAAIKELLSLNRLYRGVSEQKGDTQLAGLLQIMEYLLIELNKSQLEHTQAGSSEQKAETIENDKLYQSKKSLERIQKRIDESDLLFKMRVTNKVVEQKII